jgi:mono/diheme cytochrome c family protein
MPRRLVPLAILSAVLATTSAAAQAPSYARDIRPLLAKHCAECHTKEKPSGKLSMDSYRLLMEGGGGGPAIVPGKPNESHILKLVSGKESPRMPPKERPSLSPAQIETLRAWIAAGAKDDSAAVAKVIPDIKPKQPTHAAIRAVAYHPSGKFLAAGGQFEVLLIATDTNEVFHKLPGQQGIVTALAYSPDGNYLAVASGTAHRAGEVRIYFVPPSGISAKAEHVIPAHTDLIHDVVFSPDSATLATCGYDRLIKLWSAASGKEQRTLKDHSDAVYALAFNKTGSLLASAAADRAVKVWDVSTGKRLYTLSEATEWLYALAWRPDGTQLAAAGVDKSIRVWEVNATEGKIIRSAFAHNGPVLKLAYSRDGKTLYSLAEDRVVKSWDADKLAERKVFPEQPGAVLALAVRGDEKQLALGTFAGAVVLLDPATTKAIAQPVPVKPKPPVLAGVSPAAGPRGRSLRLEFDGKHLGEVVDVSCSHAGVKIALKGVFATRILADVTFPADTPTGDVQFMAKGETGASNALTFTVDAFAALDEVEDNNAVTAARDVPFDSTIVGSLARSGDVDYYHLRLKRGQELGVQLTLPTGSKLEAVLSLFDAQQRITVAETTSSALGYIAPQDGAYILGIRDRDYRGDAAMTYRLHAGRLPVITQVFPLGLQRGAEQLFLLDGVNLPQKTALVKAPANATIGQKLPVTVPTPHGPALGGLSVVVGEFAEVLPFTIQPDGTLAPRQAAPLASPSTANGRIGDGSANTWRFEAKKGQRLIIEVEARRIGSPLDSVIDILDAKGQPVPWMALRSVAKTVTVFRDHDNVNPGIRIEDWRELAMDDYIYVGNELLRIQALPRHPDDDCRFYSRGGQRTGFMGTTPAHLSPGLPMYKVEFHPPGTKFAPNGFPTFTLYYRNDDGGQGYGKDSRLIFDPPADGTYQVRVSDAQGRTTPFEDSGRATREGRGQLATLPYRLTIRPPRPSYTVRFAPEAPLVQKGGGLPIIVTAVRTDGYDGPIHVQLENLPPGFTAPLTFIPDGEESTAFTLFAEANAKLPAKPMPLKLTARATIDGQEVRREALGKPPQLTDAAEILTYTKETEVSIKPGANTFLTVTIERRGGFKGRVPLEVRGLPHGVRVLDVGLNGILITEKETTRRVELYCEPWVQPQEHPIVVTAKREGKNTDHAAKSVLLKVGK